MRVYKRRERWQYRHLLSPVHQLTTTMNKAVILLGTSCLFAIAIMQVSAFYGSSMMYGGGMGYYPSTIGGGVASRGYYDNYYQRYDQYNRAQSARTIGRTVNGLQTSSILSLSKYLSASLDNGASQIWAN